VVAQIDKKKLLVLTSTFPRWEGDTEPPFVLELSRRLVADNEVTVLAPGAERAAPNEIMCGMRVLRFSYFFRRWQKLAYEGGILMNLKRQPLVALLVPFFLLAQFIAVVKLLRADQIDVIHAHWLFPQGLIAVLATRIANRRVPILCTSHGGDLFGLRGVVWDRVLAYVLRRSSGFTVVSEAMAIEIFQRFVSPPLMEVIPMGVDLQDLFKPASDVGLTREKALLYVGRLVEKKGVSYLLEAMVAIVHRYPNVSLTLVGEGPDMAALQHQARDLNLEDNVTFMGAVTNSSLPAIYSRHALFVLPSVVARSGDQEGFGLVLVEAMGSGCVAISSDLPATRDIVEHGVSGIRVPPASPVALSDAILELLGDRNKVEQLATSGREYVLQRYDWSAIADRYQKIFATIT
jgi:glycosyltransferase involved in cell wall biosynthesis